MISRCCTGSPLKTFLFEQNQGYPDFLLDAELTSYACRSDVFILSDSEHYMFLVFFPVPCTCYFRVVFMFQLAALSLALCQCNFVVASFFWLTCRPSPALSRVSLCLCCVSLACCQENGWSPSPPVKTWPDTER